MSRSVNNGVLTSSILRGASKAIRTGKSTPMELPLTHLQIHERKTGRERNGERSR